ncbi:MAG: CFI-box-CTERM domain-containing protein [Terrisporobacter sp.]
MKRSKIAYFAGGSIGGKQGQSGGSIGGRSGHSGGSIGGNTGGSGGSIPGRSEHNSGNESPDCIVLDSLKKGEIIYADILRGWRDEQLVNSCVGNVFVKGYYAVSPKLVKLAKKLPVINKIVRKTSISIAKSVY